MSVIKYLHAKTLLFYLLPHKIHCFLVLPFEQAYIPMYGIACCFRRFTNIIVFCNNFTIKRHMCYLEVKTHPSSIIVITFMKRLIIVSEDSKGIIIKKNKKFTKKLYIKFGKRQRSTRAQIKGCGYKIARRTKHTQNGHFVCILFVFPFCT